MLQSITEAGRATNQLLIHHVCPWHSHVGIEEYSKRGRRQGNSAESQKLTTARGYLNSAKKHNCGTIVDRYLEDEYQKRSTNKDTRNPTWKHLTEWHMKRRITWLLLKKG